MVASILLHCTGPARADNQTGGSSPPPAPSSVSADPYEAIDQHALAAPASATGSVENLARYLTSDARTESEKARAIYRWITANITYNVYGLFTGNPGDNSVPAVLQNRVAVCAGYSALFQALSGAAGLQAVMVNGYGRGYGYQAGASISRSGPANHAWNAVKIDGQWQFIDTTWGAGYIDPATRQFVRRFDPFYFLTPPSRFVYSHLPVDPQWQLLATPISGDWYDHLPGIKEAFFRYHLALGSQQQAVVRAADSVDITILAPPDTLLLADLERDGQKLSRQWTFVQRSGEKCRVSAMFPSPGAYTLTIYAKDRTQAGSYEGALDYRVEASGGSVQPAGFPFAYGKFYETGSFVDSPLPGALETGQDHQFRVTIPGAERAFVRTGGQLIPLARRGQVFEGDVTTAADGATIFASFGEANSLSGLLKYEAK